MPRDWFAKLLLVEINHFSKYVGFPIANNMAKGIPEKIVHSKYLTFLCGFFCSFVFPEKNNLCSHNIEFTVLILSRAIAQ